MQKQRGKGASMLKKALVMGALMGAARYGALSTRPNSAFGNSRSIATINALQREIAQRQRTTRGRDKNLFSMLNVKAESIPNLKSYLPTINALPFVQAQVLKLLAGGDIRNAVYRARNAIRERTGNSINLPGGVKFDMRKLGNLKLLGARELASWTATQAYLKASRLPQTAFDTVQRLKTLEIVSDVLKTNPNLTKERDPYGISPGTHLAFPFAQDTLKPFVGKGLGMFGRQRMRLIVPGWDDASGLRGVYSLFHHAVYIGNGMVMHVGGGGYERMIRKDHTDYVGLDSLALASGMGKGLYIVEHARTLPPLQIMYNIINSPGGWKYNMMSKNCEHFVTEVVTGVPFSAQVERYIQGGIAGIFLVAVLVESTARKFASDGHPTTYLKNIFRESYDIARRTAKFLWSPSPLPTANANVRFLLQKLKVTEEELYKARESKKRLRSMGAGGKKYLRTRLRMAR